MGEHLPAYEPYIRSGFGLGVLFAMMLWELAAPRRRQGIGRTARWPANLGIVVINTVLVRLIFPASVVGFALFAADRGWGLLNAVDLPPPVEFVAALVVLDVAIYLQHILFHAVPVLWRLHRMHHADLEFDVTTGLRFHPVEILLSLGIKFGVIAALGAPAAAALVFETVLSAASMFNHGNVRIPLALDRILRWIVVTPDMHRVHHSILRDETNSNFGFSVSWWDRLFGTYRAQPSMGHDGMTIGIEQFRDPGDLRLDRMLVQPVRGAAGTYPINRRGGE